MYTNIIGSLYYYKIEWRHFRISWRCDIKVRINIWPVLVFSIIIPQTLLFIMRLRFLMCLNFVDSHNINFVVIVVVVFVWCWSEIFFSLNWHHCYSLLLIAHHFINNFKIVLNTQQNDCSTLFCIFPILCWCFLFVYYFQIQFLIVFMHTVQIQFQPTCNFPKSIGFLLTLNAGIFTYMFSSFYIRSYNKKHPSKSDLNQVDNTKSCYTNGAISEKTKEQLNVKFKKMN